MIATDVMTEIGIVTEETIEETIDVMTEETTETEIMTEGQIGTGTIMMIATQIPRSGPEATTQMVTLVVAKKSK